MLENSMDRGALESGIHQYFISPIFSSSFCLDLFKDRYNRIPPGAMLNGAQGRANEVV
jgi:hypothetical protein